MRSSSGMSPIRSRTNRLRFVLDDVERKFTLPAQSLGSLVTDRTKQTKNRNKNKKPKKLHVITGSRETQKPEKQGHIITVHHVLRRELLES